jgi:hypothetical protein
MEKVQKTSFGALVWALKLVPASLAKNQKTS